MMELSETMDRLANTSSVHWYGQALRRDNDKFLRRALVLRQRGQIQGLDQGKPG